MTDFGVGAWRLDLLVCEDPEAVSRCSQHFLLVVRWGESWSAHCSSFFLGGAQCLCLAMLDSGTSGCARPIAHLSRMAILHTQQTRISLLSLM